MKITERNSQDVIVLDLEGRMTIDEGGELLRDKIGSVLFRGHSKVVINLSRVPHIDSGSLGVLVGSYVSAQRANGAVKLAGLSGRVVELLTIMKLITVFDCFDTEQEAVDSFMVAA
jgi:anti-sigma B factor antagonist